MYPTTGNNTCWWTGQQTSNRLGSDGQAQWEMENQAPESHYRAYYFLWTHSWLKITHWNGWAASPEDILLNEKK